MRVRGASKDWNLSIQSIAAGLAVAVGCAKQPATIQRNRPNEPKGWKMQWNANEFNFLTKRSDFFEFRNNNVLNL